MAATDITQSAISDLIILVEATPQRIATATESFDDQQLAQSVSLDEWSPLQILNHLRACEEVWMHSVHSMLAHDNPRLQEIHPRQWIKTENPYTNLPFSTGLEVFSLRRQTSLITFRTLTLTDWAREGHIGQKTHTVYSRVLHMAQHENEHCNQLAVLMKDLAK